MLSYYQLLISREKVAQIQNTSNSWKCCDFSSLWLLSIWSPNFFDSFPPIHSFSWVKSWPPPWCCTHTHFTFVLLFWIVPRIVSIVAQCLFQCLFTNEFFGEPKLLGPLQEGRTVKALGGVQHQPWAHGAQEERAQDPVHWWVRLPCRLCSLW